MFEGRDFIREKVRMRDGHRCRLCDKKWTGKGRRFDVHHLDKGLDNPRGYEYDRKNIKKLVTLCVHCHRGIVHPMLRANGRLKKDIFDRIRKIRYSSK